MFKSLIFGRRTAPSYDFMLERARAEASKYRQPYVSALHLLLWLLAEFTDSGEVPGLAVVDIARVRRHVVARLPPQDYEQAGKKLPITSTVKVTFERAEKMAKRHGVHLTPQHVLVALLEEDVDIREILAECRITDPFAR